MKVVMASIFRDSAHYVDRYFDQVNALRKHTEVRLALAEGDSADGTYEAITGHLAPGDSLVRINHGGRKYGSIDHPVRWDQIATVVSGLISTLRLHGEPFIWIESDLLWKPETMVALVKHTSNIPAVAPMVFAGDSARFYDTWGFRQERKQFTGHPPYLPHPGGDLVPIDSCGSCFVLAPSAYPSLTSWSGHWPFTAGGELWLDTTQEVRHP